MTIKLYLMRWCTTLIGVQLLCGIVWVLGPLVPLFEPWLVRLASVLVLLLVWVAWNFALDWRRTHRELALAQGVAAADDEAKAVGARLETALARMRQANRGRAYLYEQPWYAVIGPPGAGKTTALLNAGLEFPLSDELGPGAIEGVGGTRLCDWWFTRDAVLIDTAGRYTTQDSNREVDRAGWQAFLDLLRRTRPRQPLNGVIVAIALNDVAGNDGALAEDHARAIRERVDELEARLGVRLPVYALFTKADLLIGFSEFFDDLEREGRAQIWGATFPVEGEADLAGALDPLLQRLSRRMFPRLDREAAAERQALIAGFPGQFASLLAPVQAFAARAFGPDAAGRKPWLRGVYFTSATQEGTPIDRLIGGLSRAFGLDQRRAARMRPEAGRSYFLSGVLRDVVFREAMLLAHRPGTERRRRVIRMAGFAACGIAAVLGAFVLLSARASSLAGIAGAGEQLAILPVGELPLDPVADADFARLAPFLDAIRPTPPTGSSTLADRIGFSQDSKLLAAGDARYRHALSFALFPRLIWRVEAQMRGVLAQPDSLYEATRIYLMLGGNGPIDRALVLEWFGREWDMDLAQEDATGALRSALRRHLAALLDQPLPTVALDGPLVAQARAIIGQVPLAQRAYSRLRPSLATGLPPWRPTEALGAVGTPLFLRLSGRRLDEGVPGAFSVTGWRDLVLPRLAHAADEAVAESWVQGDPIRSDSASRQMLQAEIAALYAADYIAAWDAMLADLDLAPLRSLSQAAQDLFILASAHSPIRAVLASAAAQLALAGSVPSGPLAGAIGAVDQHFSGLRGLFAASASAPIDLVLRPLADLQQQLAKQAASATRLPPPSPGEDPAVALRAEALRQPQPLARWLLAMATSGAALRDGGPRGVMIAAWNASGGPGPFCQSVIGNHFPFVATATTDVTLDDFTRLFGPGGAIDAFFNAQLRPYVDTAARPWRLRAVDGVNAPMTPGDLTQFQRAASIRELFFPGGAGQPQVRFDLTAGELDSVASSATLELAGTQVTAQRGLPPRPVALVWPGRQRDAIARLTIAAPAPAPSLALTAAGPWAAFRLMARARATTSGDHTTLVFSGNDRSGRFELRASQNPFTGQLLAEFRCPAVQ